MTELEQIIQGVVLQDMLTAHQLKDVPCKFTFSEVAVGSGEIVAIGVQLYVNQADHMRYESAVYVLNEIDYKILARLLTGYDEEESYMGEEISLEHNDVDLYIRATEAVAKDTMSSPYTLFNYMYFIHYQYVAGEWINRGKWIKEA